MSAADRIFDFLSGELPRQLSFSFRLDTSRAAGPLATLRPGDTARIVASARNDAGFPLRMLRGSIGPTGCTSFPSVPFGLARLDAGASADIAQLGARIVALPERGSILDHLATVSLSFSADLSLVVFEESDRPLAHVSGVSRGAAPDAADDRGDPRGAVRSQGTARADLGLVRRAREIGRI